MSDYFDKQRLAFETRLKAHEGMLRHLKIAPTEEEAPDLFDDLRSTLLACGQCACPKTCLEWQAEGKAGTPPWCHKGGTFVLLVEVYDQVKSPTPHSD